MKTEMIKLELPVIKYNDGSTIVYEPTHEMSNEDIQKRIAMLLNSGRKVEIVIHQNNISYKYEK